MRRLIQFRRGAIISRKQVSAARRAADERLDSRVCLVSRGENGKSQRCGRGVGPGCAAARVARVPSAFTGLEAIMAKPLPLPTLALDVGDGGGREKKSPASWRSMYA